MNCLKSLGYLITALYFIFPVIPFNAFPQPAVQVTIDASTARRVVSPFIYGKNNNLNDNLSYGTPLTAQQWQLLRDAGITMFRESGGNNSTKYNWRRKLSSHPDWYNNVYSHDWDYAAGSLLKNIPGASGMWTLPLIGKAAKSTANNFNDWNYNQSKWWNGCAQNLAGGGTVNTAGGSKALTEGNPDLYLENWPPDSVVGILKKWFGPGGLGYDKTLLRYWNLDNEPEIWNGTHDDVMKTQISAEDFMQRWFETAKKARALFPEIKLVGPVPANEWQWYNWNGNWISYGGKNYVYLEYFIKRIADEQKASGIRLLDVLDIHFYPGETASAEILQTHRIFFDKAYVYPGHNGVHRINGWDTSINKEYIFERCREWLVKYLGPDHGVTFSVTETGTPSGTPVNVNAIWYASMLGEFARKGVEIYTPWDWKPGMYEVLHLFTRYNHSYYLDAVSGEELYVSAYTTTNQQADSLTVVLVNRSLDVTKETQVRISNYTLASGPVSYFRLNNLPASETFKSHSSNALKTGTIVPDGNTLSVSLPPLSVTSLLVRGTSLEVQGIRQEMGNDLNLAVCPNPSSDFCRVTWPAGKQVEGKIEVFNSSGYCVLNAFIGNTAAGKFDLRTSGWPGGIYFVTLKTESETGHARLVVTR